MLSRFDIYQCVIDGHLVTQCLVNAMLCIILLQVILDIRSCPGYTACLLILLSIVALVSWLEDTRTLT